MGAETYDVDLSHSGPQNSEKMGAVQGVLLSPTQRTLSLLYVKWRIDIKRIYALSVCLALAPRLSPVLASIVLTPLAITVPVDRMVLL
jgi:hypothetical protein